jgi:hypothetical protein
MNGFTSNQYETLAARFEEFAAAEERRAADITAEIGGVERSIAELKEREPYAVGNGLKREITGLYGVLDSYRAAASAAQDKAQGYREAAKEQRAQMAKLTSAAGKVSGALAAERKASGADL